MLGANSTRVNCWRAAGCKSGSSVPWLTSAELAIRDRNRQNPNSTFLIRRTGNRYAVKVILKKRINGLSMLFAVQFVDAPCFCALSDSVASQGVLEWIALEILRKVHARRVNKADCTCSDSNIQKNASKRWPMPLCAQDVFRMCHLFPPPLWYLGGNPQRHKGQSVCTLGATTSSLLKSGKTGLADRQAVRTEPPEEWPCSLSQLLSLIRGGGGGRPPRWVRLVPHKGPGRPAHGPQCPATLRFPQKAQRLEMLRTTDL